MQLYDDRYGYLGQFGLMQCEHCGHKFLDCNLTSIQLTELYTNYYPRKSFDIEMYKPHEEQRGFFAWFNGLSSSAFRWVPKNVSVLDVGCGFGESLGYHTARGCDVYGVEADENIRRVVERFGYRVHVGLFNDALYEDCFFDFVTMDQVIEHVTDPLTTLSGISRILKKGGIAILSCPNASGWGAQIFGKRWINWHTPYHLQFFTKRSMKMAAEQAGLVLVETNTITKSEWLQYQWIHLATFPPQSVPSWFWSPDKRNPSLLVRTVVKLALIMHKTKINHLLTRVFDALGFGDNYVFILKKP
jgi:SAM-dependent methyltransferase